MNTEKINTPNEPEAPLLITEGMVPVNEARSESSPAETPKLIEVPQEFKATPTERELGSRAVDVSHIPVTLEHGPSNGIVVINKPAPEIIEEPGPQALRLAGDNSRITIVSR